jgi:hypothetical protein
VADDAHLVLTPLTGGRPTTMPGRLAPAASPAADRALVAEVVIGAGPAELVVYRVSA